MTGAVAPLRASSPVDGVVARLRAFSPIALLECLPGCGPSLLLCDWDACPIPRALACQCQGISNLKENENGFYYEGSALFVKFLGQNVVCVPVQSYIYTAVRTVMPCRITQFWLILEL